MAEKDPQDLGEFSFGTYFGMFLLRNAKERALAAFR
jgi:alpha/beta superfamily hydrolase